MICPFCKHFKRDIKFYKALDVQGNGIYDS